MYKLQEKTLALQAIGQCRRFSVLLLILGMFFAVCPAYAADYFVAPDGDDGNPGTIDYPFATIPYAVLQVVPGDTIYVRGGTHYYSEKISLSGTGTSIANYNLIAYPGERPILDFSATTCGDSGARGISLSGKYWYIKGLDIYKAGDNGMWIAGSNNTIEFCAFYENCDSGLQLGNGAANNTIINCDSYYNCDPDGQDDADGFAPKLTVGTGNYFYGCRAWQNCDDGWDGYLKSTTAYPDDMTTTIINCWCFKNGYQKSGAYSGGDGNGYKMGGFDTGKNFRHNMILKNCLSFQNKSKGFDQNHNLGSMTLHNCTAFSNSGNNYSIYETLASGKTAIVTNCDYYLGSHSLGGFVVQTTNSWQSPFVVTSADFASIDPAAAYGPRKADGSFPDIAFMRLAGTSDLIDGGTDVNLPYYYDAPDLGTFEYIKGDCQPDGRVDWADLKCLADNWLDSDCGTCNGADFYDDDKVNMRDFAAMAENWMK